MIHLAYDGSINSDWVAWYALNLARHDPDHLLHIICIDTDEINTSEVQAKGAELERACAQVGVDVAFDIQPSSGSGPNGVFRDLVEHTPSTPDTLLLCGVRLKSGNAGYLSGTVAEKLLSDKNFNVMAVRVTQPGLLGAPRRFLIPVAGDHKGLMMGADILKRFSPNILRINLLRVIMLKRQLFKRLLNNQAKSLSEKGWAAMKGLDDELAQLTGVDGEKIDINVTVSDDWAQEVIISANRHKSHLILMEASRKDLRAKFLYGNPIEVVLRNTPCDVAIYRGV